MQSIEQFIEDGEKYANCLSFLPSIHWLSFFLGNSAKQCIGLVHIYFALPMEMALEGREGGESDVVGGEGGGAD